MMKFYTYIRLIVIISALLCCQIAIAGQAGNDAKVNAKVIKGFCGGMMIHSGYQFGADNPIGVDPSGATFGMGGVAKLQFTKHFRSGFEGYFSSAPLNNGVESGSHNKVFWTGALAD